MLDDAYFMRLAIEEAKLGLEKDEVPVGALVVSQQQIIGKGHNLTEQLTDVTAHAEMQAITAAAQYLGAKYLRECTLYVTLEPCPMCAGALHWAQMGRVIYGAADPKRGATTFTPSIYHPSTEVQGGVEKDSCLHLLTSFFRDKRS
ncbi:MAG: nucleoside deaminase [Flavobacteriales bacterium]